MMMKHLKQSNAMKTNDLQLERRNFIAWWMLQPNDTYSLHKLSAKPECENQVLDLRYQFEEFEERDQSMKVFIIV